MKNSTHKILDKNNISITELSTDLLDVGENNFTIVVTAENESTETYNLVINKQSTEKELVEIILKDTDNLARDPLANGFDSVVAAGDKKFTYDSALKTYYYTIPYEDVTNFSVTIRTSPNSKIIYNSETSVSNERVFTGSFTELLLANRSFANIVIKAENGSVTDNFTIIVTRAAADTNNDLANIINSVGLAGFLKTKTTYETQILPRGTNTVDVDAILPLDSKAKVEYYVNNNKIDGTTIDLNGKNLIKLEIRVTSQSNVPKTYNLGFIAANTDNVINNIEITNTTPTQFSFDKSNNSYTVKVPYSVQIVNISAILSDDNATSNGTGEYGLTAGVERTIIVYATSEAGVDGIKYTIKITRDYARNNKDLLEYRITPLNHGEINILTSSAPYSFEFNRDVTSLKIHASISGNNGEKFRDYPNDLIIQEEMNLNPGLNTIQIVVLDEAGNPKNI